MNLFPFIVTVLATCVVAVMSTTISAILSLPFAIRRFRFEQRWERQADAYERILIALASMKEYTGRMHDSIFTGDEFSSDERDYLYKRNREGHRELATFMVLSGFLLSTEARNRLTQFEIDCAEASNTLDPYEALERDVTAIDNCIKDMEHLALKDLKLPQRKSSNFRREFDKSSTAVCYLPLGLLLPDRIQKTNLMLRFSPVHSNIPLQIHFKTPKYPLLRQFGKLQC